MNHQNFWPSLERVPINEEYLNVNYEDVSKYVRWSIGRAKISADSNNGKNLVEFKINPPILIKLSY